jgi:uncharacterized membrane protein
MQRSSLSLAILGTWCLALLAGRVLLSGTLTYFFLAWNLFLAFIPLAAAALLGRLHARRGPELAQAALMCVWLAFLPNAPYITTDFIHLRARASMPLWYDIALLCTFAVTGVVVGYVSVLHVQRVIATRLGNVMGRLCAASALALSGFGIYLGRFLRRNSIELVTNPTGIAREIALRICDPLAYPRTLGVTVVYGGCLIVGYIVFCSLSADKMRACPR